MKFCSRFSELPIRDGVAQRRWRYLTAKGQGSPVLLLLLPSGKVCALGFYCMEGKVGILPRYPYLRFVRAEQRPQNWVQTQLLNWEMN